MLTRVTTALAVLALYIFGGEVIRGFSFAMLFGILIGTYSSIFVAAPLLLLFGVKRDWSGAAVESRRPSRGAAGKPRREKRGLEMTAAAARATPGGRRSMPTATAASASPR